MKRRNLIGSLLAGVGVMFTGFPRASASPMDSHFRGNDGEGQAGSSHRATVRVIYADPSRASWEAVTDGGILVTGATLVALGNLQIVHDAAVAIAAAGGPHLTRTQISLFGGQTNT